MAFHWLGKAYFAKQEYGKAIASWLAMASRADNEDYKGFWRYYPKLTNNEANRWIVRNPRRAFGLFSASIDFDPDNYEGWAGRVWTLTLLEDPQTEQTIMAWLGKFPDDPRNARTLARIAQHRGNFERAKELFLDAIKYEPEDMTLQLTYAQVLAQNGQIKEALEKLNDLESEHPNDARIPHLRQSIRKNHPIP